MIKTFSKPESPLDCKDFKPVDLRKSILNILWKDWCWGSNTLATWCKQLTHWKRFWCWERLKAGVEGDNRGWDGWMASPTKWTWVWANSRRWWRTGKPGMYKVKDVPSHHSFLTSSYWKSWIIRQQEKSIFVIGKEEIKLSLFTDESNFNLERMTKSFKN